MSRFARFGVGWDRTVKEKFPKVCQIPFYNRLFTINYKNILLINLLVIKRDSWHILGSWSSKRLLYVMFGRPYDLTRRKMVFSDSQRCRWRGKSGLKLWGSVFDRSAKVTIISSLPFFVDGYLLGLFKQITQICKLFFSCMFILGLFNVILMVSLILWIDRSSSTSQKKKKKHKHKQQHKLERSLEYW